MSMKMNRSWHKWLLAGTIAFITTVAYAYQDEVQSCLLQTPACHRTVLFKNIDRMSPYNVTVQNKDEHR